MAEPRFSLKSVNSSVSLELAGAIPARLNGWDGFSLDVTLSGGAVQATVNAYDVRLNQWTEFFNTLASDWHSLPAAFECESLEGHIRITATVDRLGHVALKVRLLSLIHI